MCVASQAVVYQFTGQSTVFSSSPYFMAAKGKTPETQCKYIHVMRNPKDVCVSLYHHMCGFKDYDYSGPFSEFLDLFLHGRGEIDMIAFTRVHRERKEMHGLRVLPGQIQGCK